MRHNRFRLSAAILAVGLAGNATFAQEQVPVFNEAEAPWLGREGAETPVGEGEREDEPLETDRDSFTPATTLVDPGRVIFESSYSFIQNRTTDNNHSFPEIITRIGLTERVELRIGWNYEIGGGGQVSGGDPGGEEEEPGSVQESQALYGLKFAINRQHAWIPQSAVILEATTPTSGPDTFTDMQVTYVFGWKFANEWQLDSSLRYLATAEEGDHYNLWGPSVVLKVPVHQKWDLHAEYFGIFSDGRAQARDQQYFSPGVHYLITNDLEIGVRVGWGLTQEAANFFSNVGLGWRF